MSFGVPQAGQITKYNCKNPSFWLNLNSLTLISLMVISLSKTRKNSLETMKNNFNNKQA